MIFMWILFSSMLVAEKAYTVLVTIDRAALTCTVRYLPFPHAVEDGSILGYTFPVLIGLKINNGGLTCTPAGKFRVTYKSKNPLYHDVTPGAEIIQPYLKDKRNKYGTRIIGLSYRRPGATRGLSIHGTNEPELIPGFGSNMCVRLLNADVEILYDLLHVGDEVEIVN
jgi:lipoprotein-anchoring transpeptidase ErfK/SrfK